MTAMEMVLIPAGPFSTGTSKRQIEWLIEHTLWASQWHEKGFFAREKPQHEIHLAAYSIGKYPVTVGEYRAFVEGRGYASERYWTTAGWQWRQAGRIEAPTYWGQPLWTSVPTLPLVGVSWYEAFAFCRWLGEKLGKQCRLPTEMEWEKAARGNDGRLYPWGDRFSSQRCNSRAAAIGHTVPAGSYSPLGDSPYGCCEMVGNVSEWVASRFEPYPYRVEGGREDPQGTAERVTRGGSWHSPDSRARTGARGMNDPFFRDNDLGFRVACDA